MTTSQSASLVLEDKVKQGHPHLEPKAPLTVAQKPRPERSTFSAPFTPVVGCQPVRENRAADYHCRWLLSDDQGHWLAPSDCPALGTINIALRMGYLVLRAPGMLRLDIPLDIIEDDDSVCRVVQIGAHKVTVVDEGDLASVWLSRYLGRHCRLVKIHPDAPPVDWPA